MKRAILPILAFAFLSTSVLVFAEDATTTTPPAAQPAATAGPETVTGDTFSLSLPSGFSKAEKREQKLGTAENPIKVVTYVSKSPTGEVCLLTYSEMSGKILDGEKMMANGRDSLLKSLSATLGSDQKQTVGGHQGHSVLFTATKPRPIFARSDMIVDGARMYQVIYLGSAQEELSSPNVQSLFSSFQVKSASK
jgi:hypothetical protein